MDIPADSVQIESAALAGRAILNAIMVRAPHAGPRERRVLPWEHAIQSLVGLPSGFQREWRFLLTNRVVAGVQIPSWVPVSKVRALARRMRIRHDLDCQRYCQPVKCFGENNYRWISKGELPAYQVHDQYRFNRSEILEWATSRKMPVSPEIFSEPETNGAVLPSLTEAMRNGGVHYRVVGRTSGQPSRT